MIGVNTPEFAFERNVDNVRRAAKDMRVDYLIAIDSNYAVWRTFANHDWPALYFIDAQGQIRHHHFGESQQISPYFRICSKSERHSNHEKGWGRKMSRNR